MKQQQATRAVRAPDNEAMTQLASVMAGAQGVLTLILQDFGGRVTPVDAIQNLPSQLEDDTVMVQSNRQGWGIIAQLGGSVRIN